MIFAYIVILDLFLSASPSNKHFLQPSTLERFTAQQCQRQPRQTKKCNELTKDNPSQQALNIAGTYGTNNLLLRGHDWSWND